MKNLKSLLDLRNMTIFLIGLFLMFGCGGGSSTGELVGLPGRMSFEQPTPFGMVYIPGGSFMRGTGSHDPSYQLLNSRQVSISAFYMDETEITNNEYRQFVQYVTDSIMRRMLGETYPEYLIDLGNGEEEGEKVINWRTKLKPGMENDEALNDFYLPAEERFEHRKDVDVRKLNYIYYTYDYEGASRKSNDFSEVKMDQDVHYGSFVSRPHNMLSRQRFVRKHIVNVYPDTLCWIFDWVYSYNEPMVANYFNSPMYDHYPVVGINWKQANAFCAWRSRVYNAGMTAKGYPAAQSFRLPTEAEWEYAARGGLSENPYPWGGPYARNINGCVLGNFKPGRGNYTLDGSLYPCIVAHYSPNDWGLYDMMGNVSEWCIDAFDETIANVHDFNPVFTYDAKDEDGVGLKRKVVKGGSFKDFAELAKVQYRGFEYQDSCKSYVGFRCVQSYLGRGKSSGNSSGSNIY